MFAASATRAWISDLGTRAIFNANPMFSATFICGYSA